MTESQDGLEVHADEFPGVQYIPSNGTEGAYFQEGWCCNCERDKVLNGTVRMGEENDDDFCSIVGASYRGEAVEWREVDGKTLCISFVKMGDKLPDRCPHTRELPL